MKFKQTVAIALSATMLSNSIVPIFANDSYLVKNIEAIKII